MAVHASFSKKLYKTYLNMKLKKKLWLILGITVAIHITFSILLNTVFIKNIFSRTCIDYTNNSLINIKNSINTHITNVENISQNIIYNNIIYNALIQNTPSSDILTNYEHQKEINSILKDISYPQTEIQAIFIYNRNGCSYFMETDNNNANVLSISLGEFADSVSPSWSCISDNVYLSRSIYNKNTFEKIGTIIILLKKDVFEEAFRNIKNLQSVAILTIDLQYIYSNDNNVELSINHDDFDNIIKSRNGSYIDKKNKDLVCFVSLSHLNWSIISSLSLSTLYKDIDKVRNIIFIFGFFSCLLILLLNILFSHDLLKPVNSLIATIKDFETNNKLSRVEVNRKDELGYLMTKYNDLVAHIIDLINTVYLEKITRKNAQIKALQAQINPHFIFNTLETINWMAQLRGSTDVSEMITHLSSLMEANAGKTEKFIPFQKEINYINDYCKIIKFRFGEQIEFRFDINEESKNIYVPILLLQPMVENAINHGTNNVNRKGIILIRSSVSDNKLMVDIIDNGIGFSPENLKKINMRLNTIHEIIETNANDIDNNHGIGLINTNERIKLYYGNEYGISVSSKQNHYCKVHCILPINYNFSKLACDEDTKII